jgi:hypothetical protein
MNKIFSLIIILGLPYLSQGQRFFHEITNLAEQGLYQNEKELEEIFIETDFKFGDFRMVELIGDTTFPYLESILSSFYLCDINNDDLTDIIYYGWGISVPQFKIMLRNRNNFDTIFEDECIVLLDFKKKDSNIIIKYHRTGCGGNDVEFVDNMIINKNLETSEWKCLSDKAYFYSYTLLPKSKEFEKRFVVINEIYNLRLTPEIKDDNIQAVFKKGDKGTALSSLKDETGRVWWFVIMDNNIDKPESNFDFVESEFMSPQKARDKKWYGWISSRYLEEL